MIKKIVLLAATLIYMTLSGQPTSYSQLRETAQLLTEQSGLVKMETIGTSVQGREITALFFSKSGFGTDQTKIKVLIHAQQHGNEQSGKEGALMLAKELIKDNYSYFFEKIDLVIVPQVNPDGSEKNERRN